MLAGEEHGKKTSRGVFCYLSCKTHRSEIYLHFIIDARYYSTVKQPYYPSQRTSSRLQKGFILPRGHRWDMPRIVTVRQCTDEASSAEHIEHLVCSHLFLGEGGCWLSPQYHCSYTVRDYVFPGSFNAEPRDLLRSARSLCF